MANYNLTQTGDEVQAYIDSIPVIDVTGTLSGSNIVFATNPYTQIAANYAADCGSIVRLTVGTAVYLLRVTQYDGTNYNAAEMSGAHNVVATIGSSSASATIDAGIDATPTQGSDNLVKSGGVVKTFEKFNVENTELIYDYPVVAGASNGKSIEINLQVGYYSIIVEDIDTGNTGTYTLFATPSNAISSIRSNCEIGKERGFIVSSPLTKLDIGDINSSITNSGNMRIVLLKLDNNQARINARNNIEWNFSNKIKSILVNGTLSNGNYGTYRGYYRACSVSTMLYDRDITIKAKSGYKFGIQSFNADGTYKSDSGWQVQYNVLANTLFKIVITTTNDNIILSPRVAFENVEITTLLDSVLNGDKKELTVTGKGGTGVTTNMGHLPNGTCVKFTIDSAWDISSVGADSNNILTINFQKAGSSTAYDMQAWSRAEVMANGFPHEFFVKLPTFDYESWNVFIRATSGTSASLTWELYQEGELLETTSHYLGEPICVGQRYAPTELFRIASFGVSTSNINAQGMAVADDRYIIQGSNKVGVGTHIVVLDTITGTGNIITYEMLSSGQGFHMNTICLGEKYDVNDTLPLLYASEFYNQHTCKVIRIANDFASLSVVQTISYSGDTIYGGYDWVLDKEDSRLYILKIGTNITLYEFPLPENYNDVVYTDVDIIKTITIPNTTGKILSGQGGRIINKKLWMTFGADTSSYPAFMIVADIGACTISSFLDLTGYGEPESVAAYKNGALLCCSRGLNQNITSLANPAYVYMLFNV